MPLRALRSQEEVKIMLPGIWKKLIPTFITLRITLRGFKTSVEEVTTDETARELASEVETESQQDVTEFLQSQDKTWKR